MARVSKKRSTNRVIAIIGEGETEKTYFESLKSVEKEALSKINLVIKPELPGNSSFSSLVEKAEELINDGAERSYVVLDMDVVKTKYRSDYQKKVQEYSNPKNKYNDKITFIENDLCFELWILYHFQYTTAPQSKCDCYTDRIKRSVKDYDKNYAKLYEKLKEYLPTALANAEKSQKANPLQAYSQMDKIFKGLGLP
jgi:hypothetical protein